MYNLVVITIAEEEPYVGKNDARLGKWVEITMKKLKRLLSITDGDERKHSLDYTHVDIHYVEDQRKNLLSKLNLEHVSQRDEISDLKKVIEKWTSNKPSKSPSKNMLDVNSDSKSDNLEPLPPLPKLTGAKYTEIKKVPEKRSAIKAPKKRTMTVSPSASDPKPEKKADSSTEQLLLTLMKEGSSLRKAPLIPSPFITCKYCGFNDHYSDECDYYFGCDIGSSIAHETTDCTKKPSSTSKKARIANKRSTEPIEKYSKEPGFKVVFGDNSSGDIEGYGLVNYNGITFTRVNWIWHKRLSHLNFKNINKLARQNLIAGLSSLSFSKDNTFPAYLFRPVKPQTISHNKYTLVKVDEYSRTIENLNEVRVKELRSDNGNETDPSLSRDMERQHMMCSEEDHLTSATSMCLVVLCTFTITKTTWENFMLNLMMDSSLSTLQFTKHYRYLTSKDKKWRKLIMLHSVKMMKLSPKQAQKVMKSTLIKTYPFLMKPRSTVPQCSRNDPILPSDETPLITTADDHHVANEQDDSESVEDLGFADDQVSTIREPISEDKPSPTITLPSAEVFTNPHVPQDRWSREKYIELVNILSEPQAGVTTRSRIRDSKAASTHECLYVNFLSKIEPKKLAEALEEE
ncbi:retrovirus-related pol polyprotein from transposon TNT 1-94 [Tanacetum coccineum]|uniref:Retrovirus-related pol polyprotein from transposon TNT 1-94 n=1 Tax=Tanacetum coccineum TaxID=301880 RepID=A0ABQ5FPN8_9ASTR